MKEHFALNKININKIVFNQMKKTLIVKYVMITQLIISLKNKLQMVRKYLLALQKKKKFKIVRKLIDLQGYHYVQNVNMVYKQNQMEDNVGNYSIIKNIALNKKITLLMKY